MRRGFTFIELIFVVTIVGILVAVAIPRLMEKDDLSLAADQVMTHIRYAQHLALMDDKYAPDNRNWFRGGWQISFHSNGGTGNRLAYTIYSDLNGNRIPALGELATDPLDRSKFMTGGFGGVLEMDDPRTVEAMCLECTYNITLAFDFDNGSQRLAFDELGRPYTGYTDTTSAVTTTHFNPAADRKWITIQKHITLTHPTQGQAVICIEPETGYAHRCD